jgi:hypothetical protein
VDARGLEGFGERHRRQQGSEPPRLDNACLTLSG